MGEGSITLVISVKMPTSLLNLPHSCFSLSFSCYFSPFFFLSFFKNGVSVAAVVCEFIACGAAETELDMHHSDRVRYYEKKKK